MAATLAGGCALDLPGLAGGVLDREPKRGAVRQRERPRVGEGELARLGQRRLGDLRAVAAGRDPDRVAVPVALDRDDGRAADDLQRRGDLRRAAVVAAEGRAGPEAAAVAGVARELQRRLGAAGEGQREALERDV